MTPDGQADDTDRSVLAYDKIPVTKGMGTVWRARRNAALKRRRDLGVDEAWRQAVRYYNNDQLKHRSEGGDGDTPGNQLVDRILPGFSETENIVFANVISMVPALYAKNPGVEVTSVTDQMQELCTSSERLINVLLNKKESPGVAAKGKIRRSILSAILCNQGWIEVGWIFKDDMSENAASEMERLLDELKTAEKPQEIKKIEGQIMELEERLHLYEDEGPLLRYHPASAVLRDPDAVEEDLSDAQWIMIRCIKKTSWLRAKYAQKNGRNSLYEPTHILPIGEDDTAGYVRDSDGFTVYDPETSYDKLGYGSADEYRECQVTVVWYVWDRTTRRCYMYHDKDWTWPIWVYEDPLGLTTFFPVVPLNFYNSVAGGESKGEVAYYLDQQDAINLCNSLHHAARSWAASKVFYDSNKMTRQEFERIMYSRKFEGVGIPVPDGMTLDQFVPRAAEHPALKQLQLFDKTPFLQAIDRISATSEVMRGGQFKTNTTNDAIAAYQGSMQNRFDDLVDQVEDFVGQVSYLLLQLCWKYMTPETVIKLIGPENQWANLTEDDIAGMSVQVVGSSTLKPTSMNKRKEALEVGQVLGQFARVTPVAAMVTLRMFERAFDGVVIKEEEWQSIQQSLMPQPMAQPGQEQIPPEVEQAVQQLIQQGVPPREAVKQVMEGMNSGNSTVQ